MTVQSFALPVLPTRDRFTSPPRFGAAPFQCCRLSGRKDRGPFVNYQTQRKNIPMNVDRLKAKWMQAKGDLKQRWGRWTRDESRQREGRYDQTVGLLQERYGSHHVGLIQERYGKDQDDLIRWAAGWEWRSTPERK